MNLDLQFKIKEKPHYLNYLRSHCYWYKILNREPWQFKNFEEEVKKEHQLSKMYKLEQTLNTFEMIEKLLGSFK